MQYLWATEHRNNNKEEGPSRIPLLLLGSFRFDQENRCGYSHYQIGNNAHHIHKRRAESRKHQGAGKKGNLQGAFVSGEDKHHQSILQIGNHRQQTRKTDIVKDQAKHHTQNGQCPLDPPCGNLPDGHQIADNAHHILHRAAIAPQQNRADAIYGLAEILHPQNPLGRFLSGAEGICAHRQQAAKISDN